MRVRGLLFFVSIVSALSLSITACSSGDDDDDGFNPQPALVSIALTGGTTVTIGTALQLTATGTFDDATTANITTTSAWATSDAGIATVGASTGLVTGVAAGTTTITATRAGIVGSVSMTAAVGIITPPGPPIAEVASFVGVGGTEVWLCFDHQFNGAIDTLLTDDGGACADIVTPGVTSVIETATRKHLMIDGLTGCVAGSHDWQFDYTDADDARCTGGCVKEYDFSQTASATFGGYCGPGAAIPFTALSAIFEETTALPRFTVTAGPGGETTIQTFRVYANNGTALLSECTAAVTLAAGGTGAFDPTCSPDLALVDATNYTTMMVGKLAGITYSGRIDFVYESTP